MNCQTTSYNDHKRYKWPLKWVTLLISPVTAYLDICSSAKSVTYAEPLLRVKTGGFRHCRGLLNNQPHWEKSATWFSSAKSLETPFRSSALENNQLFPGPLFPPQWTRRGTPVDVVDSHQYSAVIIPFTWDERGTARTGGKIPPLFVHGVIWAEILLPQGGGGGSGRENGFPSNKTGNHHRRRQRWARFRAPPPPPPSVKFARSFVAIFHGNLAGNCRFPQKEKKMRLFLAFLGQRAVMDPSAVKLTARARGARHSLVSSKLD